MEKWKKIIFGLTVFFLGITALYYIYANRLNWPVIRSDGEGYYAYLPAFFIYHDITLREVVEGPLDRVPQGASIWPDTNRYFIKYPMGEAILMSPFFLMGYAIEYVRGKSPNGYSVVFQYMAAFAGLFYAVMGLLLLWSVLQKYFKTNTILIVLIGILLGTNLFHYATYDNIFSHIYSFFLFALFLFFVERVYGKITLHDSILFGMVAGLIIITRPTNGLWLLFGLFFGINSVQGVWERLSFLKLNWSKFALALFAFFGVIFLQLLYWREITGSFFVYSYTNEPFNFNKPEILNVLFSVRKGLFFWSPILLTVFPGIFFVRKIAKAYFLPILIFFPINVYVISSWATWWYGGSFGQRPFVESLPMFAITLCALYDGVSVKWKRVIVLVVISACMLSVWLMFKYWVGIIPYDGTTWDYFVETFFKIRFPQ